jgi:hypothetical protein
MAPAVAQDAIVDPNELEGGEHILTMPSRGGPEWQ